MKKPAVLMVHNYYQIGGGEHTVFNNEVKLLRDHGHKVITYTRSNDELKKDKWKLALLPFTTTWSFKTYREVKRIIKDEHIDIIHCQNTFPLISPSIYYAAWKMNVPVVQTIHNFRFICPDGILYRDGHICEECIHKGLACSLKHGCYRKSKIQTFVVVAMLRIHRWLGTYRKLNLICLTEFNKNKLLEVNKYSKNPVFDENRIYIKPNFVFNDVVSIDNKKEIPNRNGFFLYIGRIEKEKGVETIVKAFKQLPDQQLIFAGEGNDLEECKKLAADNNNIYFCGQVEHDQIPSLIANSKAVVMASEWYEGFPMVIAEVFSQGKPIITSNLGNAGALVDDGITGFKFESGSVDSLIKAIIKLNNSHVNFESTTRNIFEKSLSDKSNYSELANIYNEITEKSVLESGGVTNKDHIDQYIFAGRLDQSKGIRILLEAWKILNEEGNTSKLIVCGNGPEEQWCKDYIRNNNLKNIEMKGFVSNTEVKKYVGVSKALILPSQCYETFGMVVLEAFSAGTPVICTNIGSPNYLVQEGVTGLKFHSGSPVALASVIDSIKQYSFDPNVIIEMYRMNFDSEQNYQKLLKIYWNINDEKYHYQK